MGEESPKPASTPTGAVFLSYASQDTEAAQRICEALRSAGIEVWFDQSELRGGDVWDQKIRREIHDCALFIPIVSQHTRERLEGYFRREWKLAVERTHDMAEQRPFLVPVVVDSTGENDAIVPDLFRAVQWTRLPAGATPHAFIDRIQRLLSPEASTTIRAPGSPMSRTAPLVRNRPPASRRLKQGLLVVVAVVIAGAVAYFAIDKLWISKQAASPPTVPGTVAQAAFNPPPHSIAVLPFVNMSGDKEQEYFSDGLTEELLNSLSRINELQVAARTSSFSFQGEHPDISTVAHKLNVGAVLEGSVRRSAHTVRIAAQLVNGITGFHLWSQTYDRDLGDVLKLQTEIATAVASALKVTLLGNLAARIEAGGTRNPAALDAYLRGSKAFQNRHGAQEVQAAINAYTEAIGLDPNYATAFAARALALVELGGWWTTEPGASREAYGKAQADARKAIALAPDLGDGHLALAEIYEEQLEFAHASEEYERAVALAPGNAEVFRVYSDFAGAIGRLDAGVTAARRAVLLDPLNPQSHAALAGALWSARRFNEAKAAFQDALALDPDYSRPDAWQIYYSAGAYQDARAWCEKRPGDWGSRWCLAMVYDKLGRHADAEAELARFKAENPVADGWWYQYATIYAQWGDTTKALTCLERALSVRHDALVYLKVDPLLDPLRKEPRFQAIERALKFPD